MRNVKRNIKLWTGRTVRDELISGMIVIASVHGWTVSEALEHALDGAENNPPGSIKRESLTYWDSLSVTGQAHVLGTVRRRLLNEDRLLGRRIQR